MSDTTIHLEETYLIIWKRMLNEILGWSEQEVVDWAARYRPFLADPNDAIYHEDPQYWAASTLIPALLNEKLLPDRRSRLRKEILDVLGVKMYLIEYLSVDWKQYKSSVNAIVEKYKE